MADYHGTTGIDLFFGANVTNTFIFAPGELQNVDQVQGGTGTNFIDTLQLVDHGSFVLNGANLIGVSRIERIEFYNQNLDDCSLTLTNALVASSDRAGITGQYAVTVVMAKGNDTIDVSNVNGGFSLSIDGYFGDDDFIGGDADVDWTGGEGDDHLLAGLGTEIFYGGGNADSVEGTAAAVDGDIYASGDDVSHVTGESLTVTTAGTFSVRLGGFETINLANGTNHATFDQAVFLHAVTIEGGSGDDIVTMIDPDDENNVGDGNFGLTFNGHNGDDQIYGTLKNDKLNGGDGVDILDGKDGNDRITGGLQGDLMYGGDGDDRFINVGTGDLIVELADGGIDTIETALATTGMAAHVEKLIYTGSGATDVTGNAEANTITGGDQGDTLRGAVGDDTLNGGDGGDTLFGQKNDDTLRGEEDDDILDGGQGDDVLFGGGGNDTFRGGDGFDTADYSAVTASLDIDMDRADEVLVNGTAESLASIEKIIGGDFDDIFVASNTATAFFGEGGDDTLDFSRATSDIVSGAELGNEHVIGGSGNDALDGYVTAEGGNGDDVFSDTTSIVGQTFDGGDGIDTVKYGFSPDDNKVDLEDNSLNRGAAAGDTLIGIENLQGSLGAEDDFYGTAGDNLLDGLNGANVLFGREGNDTLLGGSDQDQIFGDEGDDIVDGKGGPGDLLYGGTGNDTADYHLSPAGITMVLQIIAGTSFGSGTGGWADGDTLEDFEIINGSAYADTITGDDRNNQLIGNGGADVLTGGGGRDILTGTFGDDRFVWLNASDSEVGNHHDTVTDFAHAIANTDIVDLSAIDARPGGHDNAFHFTGHHAADPFSAREGELRIFQSGGETLVQGDIDGDAVADFEIAFTGLITFTAADFVL